MDFPSDQKDVVSPAPSVPSGHPITWRVTLAFWWGLGWRSAVWGLPVSFLGGFIGAFWFQDDPQTRAYISFVATLGVAPIYFFVLMRVLRRGISGYEIRVFKNAE